MADPTVVDSLFRDLWPVAERLAFVVVSLKVGGVLSLNSDEYVERRVNGFYLVDVFRHSSDPVEPAAVVYMFLADVGARVVNRLYVYGAFSEGRGMFLGSKGKAKAEGEGGV